MTRILPTAANGRRVFSESNWELFGARLRSGGGSRRMNRSLVNCVARGLAILIRAARFCHPLAPPCTQTDELDI